MKDASLSLFRGELVRLRAFDKMDGAAIASWTENAEYMRLVDTDAARPWTAEQATGFYVAEKPDPHSYTFALCTLADDRLIGFVSLHSIEWNNAAAVLSIGIGDPGDWGKGYGSDALRVILRYAFCELNLHRVGLDVISSNARAIRAYEKVGFRQEGRVREAVHRDGQRYDRVFMGILRDEWQLSDKLIG